VPGGVFEKFLTKGGGATGKHLLKAFLKTFYYSNSGGDF
jgi:hypothetical protein